MSDEIQFPWRHSAAGTFKRDTGDSKKSVEHYGPIQLVFVRPPYEGLSTGWTAELMGPGGKFGTLGPFDTAEEARNAADEAWPWWNNPGPAPRRAWWDISYAIWT